LAGPAFVRRRVQGRPWDPGASRSARGQGGLRPVSGLSVPSPRGVLVPLASGALPAPRGPRCLRPAGRPRAAARPRRLAWSGPEGLAATRAGRLGRRPRTLSLKPCRVAAARPPTSCRSERGPARRPPTRKPVDFGLRRWGRAPVGPFSAVSASRGRRSPRVWAPVGPFPDDRTELLSPEGLGRPARVGRSLLPEGRVRLGVPPSAPFEGALPRVPASVAFPEGRVAAPSPQPPVPGFRGIHSPLAADRGSGQFGIVLHRWRRSCPRTRNARWPEPAFALSQVLASDTEVPKFSAPPRRLRGASSGATSPGQRRGAGTMSRSSWPPWFRCPKALPP
jgi:hypothetical protein